MMRMLILFISMVISIASAASDLGVNGLNLCPQKNYRGKFYNVCAISFYRLLAAPEKYHKKTIDLTGFVVRIFDYNYIFPNSESFHYYVNQEAVMLSSLIDYVPAKDSSVKFGIQGVRVIGVFDAKQPTPLGMGFLRVVKIIAPRYRIDDSPPLPPLPVNN